MTWMSQRVPGDVVMRSSPDSLALAIKPARLRRASVG